MNAPNWAHGDPNRVVRDVLAEPAYAANVVTTAVAPKPTLVQLAWNWLVDHVLGRLLHPIAKALAASHSVGTAIGVVLVVVSLGALAFVGFRLIVAFVRPFRGRDGRGPVVRSLAATHGSADWRGIAREAAARGDFANAIAALFAAALVALDERAVVAFDPARTPGEYRRLVRRERRDASVPFDDLAERFVLAAYAPDAPSARDFEAAERALDAFEPAVTR